MATFRDYGIDLPEDFSGDRKTLCPQCSATRRKKNDPCLSVNGDTGVWHCHNCGWSGRKGERAAESSQTVYRKPEPFAEAELVIDPAIEEYFKGRGISRKTLYRCGVISTVHYLPGTGEDTLCIAFQYFKNGQLLNVKYRDANKNMAQEQNPEPCLWNYDMAQGQKDLFITEGEIDALTLVECGFPGAVSVDKGAPQVKDKSHDKKLECVERCRELLESAETVFICSDRDEPGQLLEKDLIALAGAAKCKIPAYPEGCKDLNDVLVRHGRGAVIDAIRNAKNVPVPGIRKMSEFTENILDYWRKGHPRGFSTGWKEFDENFTLQPGSVTIITGIPTSGKSEFLHALLINAWREHSWKSVLYSPEMLPVDLLFANFAEKLIGKPFFGKAETRMTYGEVQQAIGEVSQFITPILPDTYSMFTLEEILRAAKVCIDREGVKVVAIDPYNRIRHAREGWMSETDYIGQFMGTLVSFAKTEGVAVFLVAHPTKLKKDERSKQYPIATLYDISGSANFYNMTDNGLSLYREMKKDNNTVQVHVQKIKNKFCGRMYTSTEFVWDRTTGRFSVKEEETHKYTQEDCYVEPPYKD